MNKNFDLYYGMVLVTFYSNQASEQSRINQPPVPLSRQEDKEIEDALEPVEDDLLLDDPLAGDDLDGDNGTASHFNGPNFSKLCH